MPVCPDLDPAVGGTLLSTVARSRMDVRLLDVGSGGARWRSVVGRLASVLCWSCCPSSGSRGSRRDVARGLPVSARKHGRARTGLVGRCNGDRRSFRLASHLRYVERRPGVFEMHLRPCSRVHGDGRRMGGARSDPRIGRWCPDSAIWGTPIEVPSPHSLVDCADGGRRRRAKSVPNLRCWSGAVHGPRAHVAERLLLRTPSLR